MIGQLSPLSIGSIEFNLSGLDAFLDRFQQGARDISGNALGDGFEAAADSYMDSIRVRFNALSRGGGSWAMTSPAYTRRKLKAVGHSLILQYSGDLLASLSSGGPNNFRLALPDGFVTGTTDHKAKFHQYGTKNMVARPILVSPADPEMPSDTLAKIAGNIQAGAQNLANECASGL